MTAARHGAFALAAAALLAAAPASGQESDDGGGIESPRWTYELRGGILEPDLDQFETFYGDDNESYFALAGSYRFRDWLEVGGELGHMSADGVGFLTQSQQLGGDVEYTLNPVQIYANFIFQGAPGRRVVPYAGIGLVSAMYEQEVAQQEDREGRSDLGYSARVGVRFRIATHGPLEPSTVRYGSLYWRAFLFLEAQYVSAEIDNDIETIDLGGDAYLLGFRMEFDFDRRRN